MRFWKRSPALGDKGFGSKSAWLAFAGASAGEVVGLLGLRRTRAMSRSAAIGASHQTRRRNVAVLPPFTGKEGDWVVATGVALGLEPFELDALSAASGGEVQFFASHRVSEFHAWARSAGGVTRRAFVWAGDQGEIVRWVGQPDEVELRFGFPDVQQATEATVDVLLGLDLDEEMVLQVARHWSVDPQAITEEQSSGPVLLGQL
jgi:hypothetical protein